MIITVTSNLPLEIVLKLLRYYIFILKLCVSDSFHYYYITKKWITDLMKVCLKFSIVFFAIVQ